MFALARTSNFSYGQVPLEISRPLAAAAVPLAGRLPAGRQGSLTGQATLSFILLVSGVVLEIAVAGSFVAYFMNSAGFGERLSARALAAAQAGIDDAMLQIVRNKEFAAGEGASYDFTVGSDSVSVTVTRTTDGAAGVYVFTVTSTGTAGTRERRLVARVVANQITGLTKLQDVAEQAVD